MDLQTQVDKLSLAVANLENMCENLNRENSILTGKLNRLSTKVSHLKPNNRPEIHKPTIPQHGGIRHFLDMLYRGDKHFFVNAKVPADARLVINGWLTQSNPIVATRDVLKVLNTIFPEQHTSANSLGRMLRGFGFTIKRRYMTDNEQVSSIKITWRK